MGFRVGCLGSGRAVGLGFGLGLGLLLGSGLGLGLGLLLGLGAGFGDAGGTPGATRPPPPWKRQPMNPPARTFSDPMPIVE